MRLGVDIDGTLADNLAAVVARFNAETRKQLDVADVWDSHVARVYSLSEDEVQSIYESHEQELFGDVSPFEGAAEALRTVQDAGGELFLVTERSNDFETLTKGWLEKHGIPYDRLLFEPDKARACQEHGLRLFVDDDANTIADITSLKVASVLMDAPHNSHFYQHRGSAGAQWVRMYHWRTFQVIVDALLEDKVSGG